MAGSAKMIEREMEADGIRLEWRFEATDNAAATGARTSFLAALQDRASGRPDVAACALIFGELVGNAIRHAPRGDVVVELDWSQRNPVLHVSDCGRGFHLEPRLPPSNRENGRGLYIVSQIALDLRVRAARERGCTVSAVLPVQA